MKEWEDEGFVPEPVPTAGLVLTAAIVGPNSKRLRGASTRVHSKPHLHSTGHHSPVSHVHKPLPLQVIKKPERFASGEYENAGDRSACSTPVRALPHQGLSLSWIFNGPHSRW